jgi:outer membrane immunogenic protein
MRLRSLMCGLVFVGMVQGAQAADLGDSFLRGSTVVSPPGEVRWDGVYFGGQVGTTIAGADFSGTTSGVSNLLRIGPLNTPTASPFGAADHSGGAQYGGFVGYNSQWDGAVVGIEANYAHMNTTVSATNAMTGTYASADGVTANAYTATGTASVRFTDYGTLRARGGWAAGMFMPYATLGFAVAHADFNRSVSATFLPPANSGFVFSPPFAPLTLATTFSGYTYGYSLGAGLDVMLTDCFFLRAEYEYASFGDFQQVNMHLHNARIAAAFKF